MKNLITLLFNADSSITYNIISEYEQLRVELFYKEKYFNNFVVDESDRYYINFENGEEFEETCTEKILAYLENIVNPKIHIGIIPKAQKKIIQKALNFYKQSAEDLMEEGEEKNYLIFDLTSLDAIMNYEVKVGLTDKEEENFTVKEGIDFPMY